MCYSILRSDNGAMHKATSDLATLLLEFANSEPDFAFACNTLAKFKTTLNSCKSFEVIPAWLKEAKLACDRLELVADQRGRDWLKQLVAESGPAAALDVVQEKKIQPTAAFQSSVDVLKQAKLLEQVTKDDTTTPKPDLSDTCQFARNLLTLSSLSIEDIKLFFPDLEQKFTQFQVMMEAHMDKVFTETMTFVQTGSKAIHKYRQSEGCEHTVPYNTCGPWTMTILYSTNLTNSETVSV